MLITHHGSPYPELVYLETFVIHALNFISMLYAHVYILIVNRKNKLVQCHRYCQFLNYLLFYYGTNKKPLNSVGIVLDTLFKRQDLASVKHYLVKLGISEFYFTN